MSRAGLVVGALLASMALGAGGPENALVVIDPSDPVSLRVGNHYVAARRIPASNVLYMDPDATDYRALIGANLDGLAGVIRARGLEDHIDYIVITPGNGFFVRATGLVDDGCSPVRRFSMSSAYTMAFITADVLGGGSSTRTNQYFSTDTARPVAFDSEIRWRGGEASTHPEARRYYIGAMLGFTGSRGNTPDEVIAMIDRSVAADGTRSVGTYYFMSTTDGARNVRNVQFAAARDSIVAGGGRAEILADVLPTGRHDALGVMTGWASPDIVGGDFTLLPGSFADHLTSYAGAFDVGSQTKMSAWITKGASGTAGTVEEPCNYTGKFNNARFHALYHQGMTLGEAYLRSMQFIPFQSLLLGDPLTRPHAHLPRVEANVPNGPLSGVVSFRSSARTDRPGSRIASLELLIDGVLAERVLPGEAFTLDTTALADGWHELRVVARDDTLTAVTGWDVALAEVVNSGVTVSSWIAPSQGDLTTRFTAVFDHVGAAVREVRVLAHDRVVASSGASPGSASVFGRTLGAGRVPLRVEWELEDGRVVRGPTHEVVIANKGGKPSGLPPMAHSYSHDVRAGGPAVVELPGTFDDDLSTATFELLVPPVQSTVHPGTKGYRVVVARADARGQDVMLYRVRTASGVSSVALVTLRYHGALDGCRADFDGNGVLDVRDYFAFLAAYAAGERRADLDGNGVLDVRDFFAFQALYASGCR